MQQTELGRLIGEWDAKDPASEQSTALLNVLMEIRRCLESQERIEETKARIDSSSSEAPAITASSTKDSHSDAVYWQGFRAAVKEWEDWIQWQRDFSRETVDTTAATPESPPSDPPMTTKSWLIHPAEDTSTTTTIGHAEPSSECAHGVPPMVIGRFPGFKVRCLKCGVSLSLEWTAVQPVYPTTSTSARPGSASSAASSVEGGATSRSSESSET